MVRELLELLKAMGFTTVMVLSEVASLSTRPPPSTPPPLLQVIAVGVGEPPKFTVRSPPEAPKPPQPVADQPTCAAPGVSPTMLRLKSPVAAVSWMTPFDELVPLKSRPLVPPVLPTPPGSALTLFRRITPLLTVVSPEYKLAAESVSTPVPL